MGYRPWIQIALFGHLLFLEFVERLAVDAQRSRRAGFQALDANLDATLVAETIVPAVNAAERFVDFLDQLALAVTVAQFNCHVGFLAGPVIGVGKNRCFVLHGMDGAVDILAQFLLDCFENLAEVSQLLVAHVLLASLRLVRSEMLMEQVFCHVLVPCAPGVKKTIKYHEGGVEARFVCFTKMLAWSGVPYEVVVELTLSVSG